MAEDNQNERDEFFGESPEAPQEEQKRNNKMARRIVAVVLAVVLLAIGFLVGWLVRYYSIDADYRAFLWALETTKKYYYLDIDEKAVYENAADHSGKALIASLEAQIDRYSCFYTPEEYDRVVAAGEGQNVGIGVSVYDEETDGKTLPRVLLIVENSPAQKAGIEKGMYIFGYGTESSGLQSGDSTALTAFIGSRTDSFVLRVGFAADGSDASDVVLKRAAYQAAYCYYRDSETSYSFRGDGSSLLMTETFSPIEGLNDKTAYIRIDEFSGNAAEEFALCLDQMKEQGRTDLILDLRTNGGGYLSILQSVASHLLRNAQEDYPVVATAQYKSGRITSYRASDQSDFYNYFNESSNVYLLADENTASASECLIGAMIDYGTLSYGHIYLRADEKEGSVSGSSYGKGIMQSFYPGALGVMKLTVATVHWPVSGNCIHGVGVTTENGANGIVSGFVWGKDDVMLNAVIADVCG